MTRRRAGQYDKLFAVIRQNAPRHRGPWSRTQSSPRESSARATDRVDVLVFVNQPTTNKQHPSPWSTSTR